MCACDYVHVCVDMLVCVSVRAPVCVWLCPVISFEFKRLCYWMWERGCGKAIGGEMAGAFGRPGSVMEATSWENR